MRKTITLKTLEVHTCGEPTRIIVEGMPQIKGNTMREKQRYMKENLDHFRTAMVNEPRGHRDMFSAIITDPCSKDADFGVLFFRSDGYDNMNVHAAICICTAAVDERWVNVKEPETIIKLDTPSGVVTVRVAVSGGLAQSVSLKNVPSFIYSENKSVVTNSHGTITGDVVFGGTSQFHIDTDKLGLTIDPANVEELLEIGMDVLTNVNKYVEFHHPTLPINTVDYILFYSRKAGNEKSVGRSCIMLGYRQMDRAPSGTSARTAYLYQKGEIGLGEETLHENILGMTYTGKVLEETKVGEYPAVINEISGIANLTGKCDFYINEDDPLAYGFRL